MRKRKRDDICKIADIFKDEKRKRDDICKIADIFKDVLQVTPKVTNAVRIGKKGDKIRLLKITVETEKEKASILRNAVKLRSDSLPEYQRKIFITPDMTCTG